MVQSVVCFIRALSGDLSHEERKSMWHLKKQTPIRTWHLAWSSDRTVFVLCLWFEVAGWTSFISQAYAWRNVHSDHEPTLLFHCHHSSCVVYQHSKNKLTNDKWLKVSSRLAINNNRFLLKRQRMDHPASLCSFLDTAQWKSSNWWTESVWVRQQLGALTDWQADCPC